MSEERKEDEVLVDDDDSVYGTSEEQGGDQLHADDADDTQGAESGEEEEEAAPAKKKNGKMIKAAIVVVGALLVLGTIGVVMTGGKSAQPQYPEQSIQEPMTQEQPSSETALQDRAANSALAPSFDQPQEQIASVDAGAQSQAPGSLDPAIQSAMVKEIDSLRNRVTKLEVGAKKTPVPFYRTKKKVDVAVKPSPSPAAKDGDKKPSDPAISAGLIKNPVATVTPAVKPVAQTAKLDLSSDAFKLKGVMSGMAWVTYAPEGKVYIVRVGDKLPNGAIVQRIDAVQHYVGTTMGGIQ